jgi:predicted transposase/invertase (TIGR01784 family)
MKNNIQNSVRFGGDLFSLIDKGRVLDIRYDPVFKAVFTKDTVESRTALSGLISALIGKTVSVETIIANEPPVDDIRQRHLRFDVACNTDKGEPVNVEMSFNPIASEPMRLEYYVARLFVGQGLHGIDKDYGDLKETYQIAILANGIFFPDEYLVHGFLYYDSKGHVSFGGKTKIITVELVKTKPIADKPIEEMTKTELWSIFFNYLTDTEKRSRITDIINREEGIAMAANTLTNITQDEIEYARMTTLIKSEVDYRSGMVGARREGLKEGRNEAGLEIALNLKGMGLSISQISEGTGLSEEIISQL